MKSTTKEKIKKVKEKVSPAKMVKWSDAKFRVITIPAILISIVSVFLLISLTHPLEDKYKQLMDSKEIYVIDPSGQQFKVSALDSQEKTFEIFGKTLLKKMFTFDYKGSPENQKYVLQYTSQEVWDEIFQTTKGLRGEAVDVTGMYSVAIDMYEIRRLDSTFVMDVFFEHRLISKASSGSNKYMVRMEMTNTSPTPENFSGVYLKTFKIFADDDYKDALEDFRERNK